MRKADGLFRLVRSLKNNEKAIFRQYAGMNAGNSKYLKLFDLIDKTNSINDINENAIMGSLNYLNRNTYYVAKNYLFELILKSLCLSQYDTGPEDVIRNRILSVRLLYERTLFSKAYELLKKAKKTCIETENYLRLLEILKWEKNLVIEGAVKGNKQTLLMALSAEEDHALKCISNISSYRLLSFRFNSFIRESGKKNKKEIISSINFFKAHPLLKNKNKAITLPSIITFLEISASLNQMLNRSENVYKYRKKMITLMDSRPVFLEENLTNYVISLYNLTNTCFELDYLPETIDNIKKLRNTSGTYNRRLKLNTRMLINIGLSRLETGLNLKLEEYSKASENSLALAELVQKYDSILSEREKAESLLISIEGLFLNKDHDRSLGLINIVNRFNSENLDPETLIKIKLVQIFILFETGNYETAEYQAVSLQRILKKTETAGNIQVNVFKSIKQVLTMLRKNPSSSELRAFINDLPEIQTKKKINKVFVTFFKNWLRSRV